MNCKPGDLAIVVKCDNPVNQDRLVRCVQLSDARLIHLDGRPVDGPIWEIDTLLPRAGDNALIPWIPDANIRPITPPPGTVTTDEVRELYSPKQKEAA